MKNTVKKYSHFKYIMNNGKKFVGRFCVVYSLPFQEFLCQFKRYSATSVSPFGIMTTKKLGIAVKRNFIKRRIRNAFQQISCEKKHKNCVIIVARKESETALFQHITAELSKAIN
jgi:ribonuclease P protein component